jgi:hypothetical protein
MTLMRKYRAAVADRNLQTEGHRGLTASMDPTTVARWEAMCIAWEQDDFPKRKPNPYHTDGMGKLLRIVRLRVLSLFLFMLVMTESQARKELAEQEEQRLAAGGIALHSTSASAFVTMGLEIEEAQ